MAPTLADEPLGFHHRWIPGASDTRLTLLLLHGTGGDENDLLPLGQRIAPGANLLSPRGKVLEHGMPRFFRRLSEGVLDVEDLQQRSDELADFVREAAKTYEFDGTRVVAVGYSNGANIATGLLFRRPEAIDGAILMRAMVPYEPARMPDLSAKSVLILGGARDTYSHDGVTHRLSQLMGDAGARVMPVLSDAGHELTPQDAAEAAAWLQKGA